MTDHANLKWMEVSVVDRIVRMRMFIQNFNFDLLHFKGKLNRFADWLSRKDQESAVAHVMLLSVCMECFPEESVACGEVVMFENTDLLPDDQLIELNQVGEWSSETDDVACYAAFPAEILAALDELAAQGIKPSSPKEAFDLVHNGRIGHHGVKRTWLKLSKVFPGHKLTTEVIQDFIDRCPICQKFNAGMSASLQAPIRALDSEHCRHYVGFDTLSVSPPDKKGHCCIHVVKQLPSRLVGLYPATDYTAVGVARALFSYFVTYGISEVLISDPGSNITAEVVQLLLKWFGVRFRMSLTDRHESNMVERTHRETLRFLSALVHDERLQDCWGEPECYMVIQFILNDETSSETGLSPFEFTFGTIDKPYFKLSDAVSDSVDTTEYLSLINQNLRTIREIACDVQRKIQAKRKSKTPPETLTEYQPGQLVLFQPNSSKFKPSKLYPRFKGPYEVVSTYKADITCTHIVMRFEVVFHMSWLKPFFGTHDEAFRIALVDYNQYEVRKIVAYRGDPEKRSTMDFLVLFSDDSQVWIPYNFDLATARAFQQYCKDVPALFPLLFSAKEAKEQRLRMRKQQIDGVQPGQEVYINLRAWGADFYDALSLPDCYVTNYVVLCRYKRWAGKRRLRIDLYCPLFDTTYEWSAYDVYCYGLCFDFNPSTMVLVDAEFCKSFPDILL